jgi:hypothetical protein
MLVLWQKKWLFWFCEALAFVSGKTKCAILCDWHFGSFFCRFMVALSVVIGLPLTHLFPPFPHQKKQQYFN